jgi:hypothetical protein
MSGRGKKHSGSQKHSGSKKHHRHHKGPKNIQMSPGGPPAVHHHPHHHKKTKALPGRPGFGSAFLIGDVHCCIAEALASSARMAGWPVGDEDILALYFSVTDDPEFWPAIPTMLEAASRVGLAGVRPVSWDRIPDMAFQPGDIQGIELLDGDRHAVTLTRDGQWSWGMHMSIADLPGFAEETWNVRWPR